MTPETWIVLGLVVAMMVAFFTEKFPPEAVGLAGAVVLLLSGILSPVEMLSGFGNPATVTVACMFILSAGLQKTGALAALGAVLMRTARWPWLLLLLIMVVTGTISAFVNNTAAVAVLLPLVLLAARERNGNWRFNPEADYVLKPGFTLIAMATPEGRRELETLLIDMRA